MACPWCGRDDAGDRSTGYDADDYCSAACEEAALDRDADGADAADASTADDDAARACWTARVALLDLQAFVRAARTAQQALVLHQAIREIEQDVAQLVRATDGATR